MAGLPNQGVPTIPVTQQTAAAAGATIPTTTSKANTNPALPNQGIPAIAVTPQVAAVAGAGVIPASAGLGAGASVTDLEAYVRKTYGYMAGFLDIPEVRQVLLDGARNGWGSDQLYGALSATTWWKTTSASARQWAQLVSEDPATAKQQAANNAASISDIAKQHGLSLTGQQIGDLAVQSAQYGWSSDQTLDAILKNVTWSTVGGGSMTADVDKLKADAARYLMPIADSTAQDWALRMARGELTEAGVGSILQSQAAARYPWMKDLIAQGVAPADYMRPVRDTIANTLEVAPDSIDLLSPKWAKMVEVADPKTGMTRAATMNEAMLAARQDPSWSQTKNAQDLTASAVMGMQKAFGQA